MIPTSRHYQSKCPTDGFDILIHEASGDWACTNPECEYFHGAQALFEKNYVNWHKNTHPKLTGTVTKMSKMVSSEVILLEVINKIRILEAQLFNANEIITELTNPTPTPWAKLAGVSWMARRAKYLEES